MTRLRGLPFFHELVHAEQFRQLGGSRLADLYVRGFLSTRCYDAFPLEVNAYSFGARFGAGPDMPFSVESEISTGIKEGRF
jgi:hypothetical protein